MKRMKTILGCWMASSVLAASLATGGCGGGGTVASSAEGTGGTSSSSTNATTGPGSTTGSTTGSTGSTGGTGATTGTGGTGATTGTGGSTAAAPVALASNVAGPVDLFVDATTVYWSETGAGAGQGAIKSVPKGSTGSASPTVLASGIDGPAGIWVDSGYVYWADHAGQYGSINRVPVAGGATELISTSADNATEVVVADGALYSNWMAEGVIARLETSAITGSAIVPPVFAAMASATHLATDGANLIWVQERMTGSQPYNSIVFAPLGTTATPSNLYNTVFNHTIDAISGDGTSVYFTESDGTNVTVRSIALTSGNGANTTIATLSGTDSQGIGSDGMNVFYTELGAGKVVSSENTPFTVTGQQSPSRIVVEADALYWVDAATSGGSVMRLAR
jgi:hypothetical protein